jgi:hypothetical protein
VRFHKSDKLFAPSIEEICRMRPPRSASMTTRWAAYGWLCGAPSQWPELPMRAFFDLYRVGDYWLESKNALVKLARLVQV